MKQLRKLVLLAALSSSLLGLVGCHSTRVDYYYSGWYDVYGYQCGSLGPGCDYYADGVKIIDVEDPYYYGDYYWDYYYDWYYGEYVWMSPSGIIYDDWGNALNSDTASALDKDLIAQVSDEEDKVIKGAASKFAAKYGLSEEVGMKVAKTMNDWAKLGFTKGRTQEDLADFTKRLYGVNISDVESALAKASVGDGGQLEEVVNEAASNWNTSPETMKEILSKFHGKDLEESGIELH